MKENQPQYDELENTRKNIINIIKRGLKNQGLSEKMIDTLFEHGIQQLIEIETLKTRYNIINYIQNKSMTSQEIKQNKN